MKHSSDGLTAKIAIVNQHSINVGDEAAGCALLQKLERDFNIESIDIFYNGSEPVPYNSEVVSHDLHLSLRQMGYFAIAAFLLTGARVNRTIRNYCSIIEQADLVFVAPSGANIGIYRSWRFLVRLLIVVRLGKTPIFHWNTIGASGSKLFDRFAWKVLSKSRLYVREQKSKDYLESLGLKSELGPDTAFLLDPIVRVKNSRTIAFVPSELDSWHPAFKDSHINEFVLTEYVPTIGRFAFERGYKVVIVPHLRDEMESTFNEKVYKALAETKCNVEIASGVRDYRDYDEILARADLVVGMRYHTAVLAAKNHRPFIALAYENKALEVGRYTNMQEYCIDLTQRKQGKQLRHVLEQLEFNQDRISIELKTVCEKKLVPRAAHVLDVELSQYRKID